MVERYLFTKLRLTMQQVLLTMDNGRQRHDTRLCCAVEQRKAKIIWTIGKWNYDVERAEIETQLLPAAQRAALPTRLMSWQYSEI